MAGEQIPDSSHNPFEQVRSFDELVKKAKGYYFAKPDEPRFDLVDGYLPWTTPYVTSEIMVNLLSRNAAFTVFMELYARDYHSRASIGEGSESIRDIVQNALVDVLTEQLGADEAVQERDRLREQLRYRAEAEALLETDEEFSDDTFLTPDEPGS